MNNLKCRKQSFNKMICKKTNKEIKFNDCSKCPYKDFKSLKTNYIKKRTSKQSKLEKNRYSILTNDLKHCIICGMPNVNLHEIFFGNDNRHLSIKYGLVIPLCNNFHHNQINMTGIHFDKSLDNEWKIKGQIAFEKEYPDLDFLEIFGRNYL